MLVKISDTVMVVAKKVKRIELVVGVGCRDCVKIDLGAGEVAWVSTSDHDVPGPVLLEMVASALNRAIDGDPTVFGFDLEWPDRKAYTTLRLPREPEEPTAGLLISGL